MTTIENIRASLADCHAALAQYEADVANDAPPRTCSPALRRRAENDIAFRLGIGWTLVERSTFGAMLEQAERYAFAGVDRFDPNPARIPPRTSDCVPVKHQRSEPAYDIDLESLGKLGRGNRLLDAVGRRSPVLRMVLEAYHGDRGERFARPFKSDTAGGVDDRMVALYPLTPMGRKWVKALREKAARENNEHSLGFRPDEWLATEVLLHKVSPTDDLRRQRLARCAEQSRQMLAEAHVALDFAAVDLDNLARSIRRTGQAMERAESMRLLPKPGPLVAMRTSSGMVLHGPYEWTDPEAWQAVERRGCLVEAVA